MAAVTVEPDDLLSSLDTPPTPDEPEETPEPVVEPEKPEETPTEETPAETETALAETADAEPPVAEAPAPSIQPPPQFASVAAPDLSELEAKIAKGEFDPYEDSPKAILALVEHNKRLAQQNEQLIHQVAASAQREHYETVFAAESKKHGVSADTAKSEWQKALTEQSAKFQGEALIGAATVLYEQRLAALKAAAKPSDSVPVKVVSNNPVATPKTIGGAKLTSNAGLHRPPAPVKSEDDEFDVKFRGSLKNFLG